MGPAARHDPKGPVSWTAKVWCLSGVFALATLGCGTPAATPADYVSQIASDRTAKDRSFREASDSPIPPSRRDEMLPIPYFHIDPEYRVPAVLRIAPPPRPVGEIPTSTGSRRSMEQLGTLEFTLKGRLMKLAALSEVGAAQKDRLFVPFTDLTTGTETYPGGRYIDLDATATGIYDLDFNRAYHPYCYYDTRFDCPYPPPQNRLDVPIRAGERLPSPRR